MIIPHAVGYTKEDLMHLYKSRVIRRTMELKNVNSEIEENVSEKNSVINRKIVSRHRRNNSNELSNGSINKFENH